MTKTGLLTTTCWTLAAAAVLAAASPAAAQADGEPAATVGEVVVTAQRRSELSREVPITITTMSANQLQQADVKQLSEITKLTPALRFDYQGGFIQPTIRGVGTAVTTSGMGANVGIYTDGFYSPNPLAANFNLLNVENVQVLKGPQGTLFGRNTTGGAILVTTKKPSHDTSAVVEASYGRFDTQRYQAYMTTGVTENLAVDAEAIYAKSDGFIRNVHTGDKNAGASKNWGFRVGAKYDPSDRMSFLLRYQHFYDRDPSAASATNPYVDAQGVPLTIAHVVGGFVPGTIVETRPGKIASNQSVRNYIRTDAVQLASTFDLNFATLNSYTQWRKDYGQNDLDFDASNLSTMAIYIPVVDKIFTQEFVLNSKAEGPLQWTAGAFYFRDDNKFISTQLSLQGGPYTQFAESGTVTMSYAGFADVTYEAAPNLFLTAGLRYSHDEVQNGYFMYTPFAVTAGFATPAQLGRTNVPTVKSNRTTPRFVIRYKPNDFSSVYASYTRGYKAPILNVGGGFTDSIDAEKITSYEAGYKYGRGPLAFSLSAYHYKYRNLQVASYNGVQSLINNAGRSRVNGVEGDVRWNLMRGLEVNAGAAYTDAKFKRYPNAPSYQQCLDPVACGVFFGGFLTPAVDASGFRMQRSPKFTGNVGVRYTTDMAGGDLTLSSNLAYTSKFYFDAANQFPQSAYTILGARAEWTDPSDRYTLAVFGNNITGTRYRTQALGGPFAVYGAWSAPATYGASVRVRY